MISPTLSWMHFKILTRIISNIKKTANAAPKARSRNFAWKQSKKWALHLPYISTIDQYKTYSRTSHGTNDLYNAGVKEKIFMFCCTRYGSIILFPFIFLNY